MRSIKKLKSTGKAVAGSALLVGATLTGAAGLASASQHDSGSMDLGDYPQPFINSDGEVDSTIVVGSQAKTADVVGAIDIAGSLGNAAFMEEEVDVDVEGAVTSWSASNGVTLNRDNDNLFLNSQTNDQENSFDGQDLPVLETTTVSSVDNEEVELEFEATVLPQDQEFATAGDSDDPLLHVNNDENGNGLLHASVEFSDTMDFTVTSMDPEGDTRNGEEVLEDGDELELFGNTYTFSSESQSDELVLYGSSENFEVNTGSEETVTIDGNEHTFSVDYVTDTNPREATIVVDGQTRSVEDGDSVTVEGQEVRIQEIYRTGPDGQGRVEFSIGSDEVVITDNEVEVNGETVDGVDVTVNSGANDVFENVEGIDFTFSGTDSDTDFVAVGESYEDPVFGALEFHYGGPAPNAAENPAETVEVTAAEEDTADITFMAENGEEVTQTFAHNDQDADGSELFADEGEEIATVEGEAVSEDDYVVLNQNEDSGLYQVTAVDVDLTDVSSGEGEVSVTMEDVASGDSVTVEEDGLDSNDADVSSSSATLDSESVDGMDHDITFNSDESVEFRGSVSDDGLAVFPALYTAEDGAVAFTEQTQITGLPSSTSGTDVSSSTTTKNWGTVTELQIDSSATNWESDDEVTVTLYKEADQSGDSVTQTFNLDGSQSATFTGVGSSQTLTIGSGNSNLDAFDNFDPKSIRVGTSGGTAPSDITNVQVTDDSSDSYSWTSFSDDTGTPADFTVRLPSTTSSSDYTYTNDLATVEGLVGDTIGTTNTTVGDRGIKVKVLSADASAGTATVAPAQSSDVGAALTEAAAHYIQPEDDEDVENAYSFDPDVSNGAGSVGEAYTGSSDLGELYGGSLDDEDVDVAYNVYGTYVMEDTDSDNEETVTLNVPGSQSTVGMAVTGADGDLSASGTTSGSATTMTPTGFPDSAALDSEVSGSDRDQNMILVGGPAVNTLTEELASENKTWTADQYEEDTWVLDLVEGFSEDTHALVVAGHSAEDTTAASSFISNYADNQDELAGETTVSMTTSASSQ